MRSYSVGSTFGNFFSIPRMSSLAFAGSFAISSLKSFNGSSSSSFTGCGFNGYVSLSTIWSKAFCFGSFGFSGSPAKNAG
jgi:hypothetical protein